MGGGKEREWKWASQVVELHRGCGAGDRSVAGGGIGRGISVKMNLVAGKSRGQFRGFGRGGGGILEVRRRGGVGNSVRRKYGSFGASTERFGEIEGEGEIANGGQTWMWMVLRTIA